MSDLESSTNNQLPPPSPHNPLIPPSTSTTPSFHHSDTEPYIRDPKFYFRDGNTVFLVGNTLFKFQASLLDADTDVDDYEFKQMMKGASDGLVNGTGNDAHPIILPADVAPHEFRGLVMAVFGGVTNDTFLAFVKDLQKPMKCGPETIARLTNIGYLAHRFGMKRLDAWSQTQIHVIFTESILFTPPHRDAWTARAILRLVKYMQDTTVAGYRHKVLDRMRGTIAALVQEAYECNDQAPQGRIIDICAAMYKEKNLLINSPGLFGFIFAVIISLGHQSDVWAKHLTREDRRVLYVAYANFICLGNHADLELDWLTDPAVIKEGACMSCSRSFDFGWRDAFSECNGLKSRVPLEDIRHVVALGEYRHHFRRLGNNTFSFDKCCECDVKVLGGIERRIELLYCGLTEKYKFLAEDSHSK
ncbi:hypothetical protein ACGC1H_006717 [Rhizoctonia solani]